MTYLVLDKCINCKYTDCALVCPVDCFYEGANMLAIKPDECIDCGLCKDECPVDAIAADVDLKGEDLAKWMEVNKKYSEKWPKITRKKDPMDCAEEYKDTENKFESAFDPNPGTGDT